MEFPNTNWTVLASATASGDARERKALDELCQAYWRPVSVVIRARGAPSEKVEDLTQDFFIQLIDKKLFRRAQRDKGRFRSFMMGSLKNFLADDYKKEMRQKRGGHLQRSSLEEDGVVTENEELRFDQSWAAMIFERAIARVGEQVISKRSPAAWEALRSFLPGAGKEQSSYLELGELLRMSEGGAKKEVYRVRQTLREALRVEVGLTVSAPHEIDEELAHLRATLEQKNSLM